MTPAVVLHSGGQDSTTCLAWATHMFGRDDIYPVAFEYGQRHAVELVQGKKIADVLGVRPVEYISVEALSQFASAALTNTKIKVEAEASEESQNQWAHMHGLPSTFVPGRNMIFLGLAAAYGAKFGIVDLVTGVCQADDAGYPDCRESFVKSMEETIGEALGDDSYTIHAPLLHRNKAQTFKLAESLGVLDLVLEETHTCYNGDRSARHAWGYGCGQCPACVERAKGWAEFNGAMEVSHPDA